MVLKAMTRTTCILQLFERVRAHTVEEIDEAIHEQEARADSLYQTDERVMPCLVEHTLKYRGAE